MILFKKRFLLFSELVLFVENEGFFFIKYKFNTYKKQISYASIRYAFTKSTFPASLMLFYRSNEAPKILMTVNK